jgi:hypothetical protein
MEWLEIQKSLSAWKSYLTEKKGARDQLLRVKEAEEIRLAETQEKQRLSFQAQLFLLSEIVDRRKIAIESIEEIGTHALRMVYGHGYRLKFDTFEEKRKEGVPNFKMEINIASPIDDTEVITGLDDERGGGLIEIVAFSLRIAALNWLNYDGPIILDEAYKSMSNDGKLVAVAHFMKELSEATSRQIIFATHRAEVFAAVAENIIQIENKNGIANFKIIDKNMIAIE